MHLLILFYHLNWGFRSSPIRFLPIIGEIPEVILAKVHLNFANWRVSIGYIGEGSLDFRQTDHSTPE